MPTSRTTITLARIFAWLFLFLGIVTFLILFMRAFFVVSDFDRTWYLLTVALPALLGGVLLWVVLCMLATLTERVDALYAHMFPQPPTPTPVLEPTATE